MCPLTDFPEWNFKVYSLLNQICMIKDEKFVPYGIQFISDWDDYEFPRGRHLIVDKGVTGCGYTEYCLKPQTGNVVLCSPRKLLLENKAEQHEGDPNILYLENPGNLKDFKDVSKYMIKAIGEHILKCKFSGLPVKFLVTYDSCKYIVDYLQSTGELQDYVYVVDEMQSIFSDAFFKAGVEFNFVNILQNCQSVIYLSATPMLDRYLERVPEFKDLEFQKINWSESGYVETIKISSKKTKSLVSECESIIEDYKIGKYPMKSVNGRIKESKEAVFYFNNVTEILRIIRKCKLLPYEVNIICADTEDNKNKLRRLNKKYRDDGLFKEKDKGFVVGRVPLKGQPNKKYTFCTRCTYIGADFHSPCASSYIFADPNVSSLALDISLDLPQIVGRQRDTGNPFKNEIKIFYRILKSEEENTEENFINLQNRRRNSTANLLNVFNKCSRDEKVDYIQKLRSDIQVSKYTRDFVSISEKTGAPIHNEFIELAYERAYEISQKDYQDKITVTRSIENAKFEGKIEVDESSKRIVHEFIQKYFDNVSWFNDKLKLYCEFCDYYSSNIPVLVYFYSIIEDSDVYQRYYEHYGTSGCKAREYVKKRLDEGMRDNSKEDVLASELEKIFKPGDILLLRDIKSTLAKIYEKIGITSTPKASILGNYFDLKDKRIVDKSTGKQSKGYEILGIRKAG